MVTTNEELVNELIRGGYLKTSNIIEAFTKIDRRDFVPQDLEDEAHGNYPLPIGFGQTISQPLTVAFMLEFLLPQPGDKILDVGAGSGWQAALIAELIGDKGKVVAIERIPELKEMAEKNIGKYEELKGRVEVVLGDGSKGYEGEAPYDKIIAGATAGELPKAWKEQLKTGGVIVAPVGSSVFIFHKTAPQQFETKEYFGFSFVPLVSD